MSKKRLIALLMSSLLMVTLTACSDAGVSAVSESVSSVASVEASVETSVEPSIEVSVEEPKEDPLMSVNDEGFLVFGNYEQDGDDTNGAEPIEWVILGTDDKGVLLVSRYILDCRQYDPSMASITWGSSDLRYWLNTDFLNTAFTLKEQQSILEITSEADKNEYYSTDAGNETNEKVFILSVKDVIDHYEFPIWEADRKFGLCKDLITTATPYAVAQGVVEETITEDYASGDEMHRFLNDNLFISSQIEQYLTDNANTTNVQWWLRTPGNKQMVACTVSVYGRAGYFYGQFVNKEGIGVRPAIYIEKLP